MRNLLFLSLFLSTTISANIIRTHEAGFYKLDEETLKKLEIDSKKMKLGQLKINSAQGLAPYFFNSKNNKFEKNDSVIFFADELKGDHFKQHSLDDFNGFTVTKDRKKSRTSKWFGSSNKKNISQCVDLTTKQHYEKNEYLIRVNTHQYKQAPELWYWKKINQLNKKGFSVDLNTNNFSHFENVKFKGVVRSTNIDRGVRRADKIAQHKIEVLLNGTPFTSLEWDGKVQKIIENISIPKELFKPTDNKITFKVPKRKANDKEIIDIVMLDYFEISHQISPNKVSASQIISSSDECQISLTKNQFAFDTKFKKYYFDTIKIKPDSEIHIGDINSISELKIEPKNKLNINKKDVNYLIISHPNFIEPSKKIANYHKRNGKKVELVDVNHLYQNYSHGVRELYAIKNFIKDISDAGKGKLKHVLLVGDSSWDWRQKEKDSKYGVWANREFRGNQNFADFPHQHYQNNILNRDFVPTGQYHSFEGHSASDNWFVAITPEKDSKPNVEDYIPDLAIGRFPASTVEEAHNMIDKTINYNLKSKVGPWKSRILWITNSNKGFQKSSTVAADNVGTHGVMANNVFPPEMDGDNLKIQSDLSNAFNQGDLIVHFLGHGGKSIWRIGPPDLKKNRDLFTMDHVSKLQNSSTLPFVMSMSCYSAPFDHPLADSIGEKFIREANVGAVAVFASSWRNAPNSTFSRYVVEEIYANPDQSVGQAILKAKRKFKGRTMIEMYNLLGDPALKLAVPELKIVTSVNDTNAEISIDNIKFQGKAIIEFIDDKSKSLSKQEIDISSSKFTVNLDEKTKGCKQARVYAWDSQQNIDAMGSFDCPIVEPVNTQPK